MKRWSSPESATAIMTGPSRLTAAFPEISSLIFLLLTRGAYDSGGVVVVGNINIRVPNNTAGVPITLYNAANVTDVTFTLTYNPALLTITGTLDGESGVSDATSGTSYLTLLSNSDGVATFEYTDDYSTSATVDAPLILGDLVAFVPISAAALYRPRKPFISAASPSTAAARPRRSAATAFTSIRTSPMPPATARSPGSRSVELHADGNGRLDRQPGCYRGGKWLCRFSPGGAGHHWRYL